MLTRWNDWGAFDWARSLAEFEQLRRELNRAAGEGAPDRSRLQSPTAFPRVGLFDTKEQLVLRAELPGVAEDDLDITVDEGTLAIRGTRKVTIPEGYSVHRQERAETTFARSFALPCKVDSDKAQAELKYGVLTLTLPKAPEVQPRQIAVKAG
ncbi:MAG: Hsp20/alpha crystallin family protein [Deltaproteobacteria bacterium]|jgi:HSP20 family protein|nr:Hsp20/alpha crystallin family protein [Deltaproteobacteria bacterium]MBW2534544.1 Hsp20/alpha crystallin family protein [Deltaproteobacteria bacterium]